MANNCTSPTASKKQAMGLGDIGTNRKYRFKRRFRWTFTVKDICGAGGRSIPYNFVKLAARPNLTIEETEINFLHGKTWLPGKGTWESITVTYYDASIPSGGDATSALLGWLASVYDFTDPVNLEMGSSIDEYGGTGVLVLYDGCGTALESWELGNMWPQAVNFGDLDYSNSEPCEIELTLRYTQVKYCNHCGPQPSRCPCVPCG